MSHSVTVLRLSQGVWVTTSGRDLRPGELVRLLAQNTTYGKVTFTLRRASGPLGPEVMFARATQPSPTVGDASIDVQMPHQEGVYILDVANDLFWVSAEHVVSIILRVSASAPPPPSEPPPGGGDRVPIIDDVKDAFKGLGEGVKTLAIIGVIGAVAVALISSRRK